MGAPKKPRHSLTPPVGVAAWAWLNKPQLQHNKKEHEAVYKVDIMYQPDDPGVQELREELEAFALQVRESDWGRENVKPAYGTHIPFLEEMSKEDDQGIKHPTGRVLLRTKLNQYRKSKDSSTGFEEQRIPFYDAQANLIGASGDPNLPKIGNGSRLRVPVSLGVIVSSLRTPPELTITAYIDAVQIIELVEWTPREIELDAVEGGYVYTPPAPEGIVPEDAPEDYTVPF